MTCATSLRTLICMAVSIFPALRWRILAAALALSGSLLAADKLGDKSSANYNIPLWEEGKVPLATGNGPLDARSSRSSCRPKASATAAPW